MRATGEKEGCDPIIYSRAYEEFDVTGVEVTLTNEAFVFNAPDFSLSSVSEPERFDLNFNSVYLYPGYDCY